MAKKAVQSIFIRQITPGDFWHIERGPATDAGGGGQTYIDIPLSAGNSLLEPLWEFLDIEAPANIPGVWASKRIWVSVLGDTTIPPSELSFDPRQGNNRYKISNQARQKAGSTRHAAWTEANGFPQAPDNVATRAEANATEVSHLKIYIVKTDDGEYYAGFVNQAEMPSDWASGVGLESLFDSTVSSKVLTFDSTPLPDIPPLVQRILNAWKRKNNVLLYGPPGTGKTYAMNLLWKLLDSSTRRLTVDTENKDSPFENPFPFEIPIRREWVTFHQNYSYENFILALRPESTKNGLTLKPRTGMLMDAAISIDPSIHQPDELKYLSAVIYIDEINRGNVSRIFGEFITFMDADYRADSEIPLPVPLPAVRVENNQTEPIERTLGGEVQLPVPWYFPQNVYLLASMNSVDRAVTPLDSALARRFARIEVGPDMQFLAEYLGIQDTNALLKIASQESQQIQQVNEEEETEAVENDFPVIEDEIIAPAPAHNADTKQAIVETTGEEAFDIAWLLLYRINYDIAVTLGTDFELGHTYVMDILNGEDEEERFRILARVWDQSIFPQLQERFVSRPDELQRILRVDKRHTPPTQYLFGKRSTPPGTTSQTSNIRYVLNIPTLEDAPIDQVKITLRYLAGI